jgi:acetate kinase
VTLDPAANAVNGRGHGGRISREARPVVAVVPTNEELMIALDTAEIVARAGRPAASSGPLLS